ncbi:MAG: DUF4412 domain-containing protein [Bacteroidales bacterium]|jgi:hypothetical protein
MKTRSIILLLVLAIMLPGVSNAQGWILRRAIDRKIDQKVDSAVDKSAKDKAKEKEQTDQKQSDKTSAQDNGGTKATGRGLFGGKIDIKYNDEYKFTGRIYMQMETYDKKDVMKSDYYTYYNSNTLNAGIEVSPVDAKQGDKAVPTVFLFDNDNRCFMMLMENKDSKTGIISSLPSDSAMAAQTKNQKGANPEKATITKTGNSRVIAGYKCDEYKIVDADKDGYSNVWMTKDVKLKADKKYWGKAGVPTYYNYPGFEGAMMLAMESFDKNNNPGMKMETKEINDNFSHSISTLGITFMKMNFGQAGKK